MKLFRRIKFKILLVSLLFSLLLAILFSSFFIRQTTKHFEEQQLLTVSSKISLAASNIDQTVMQLFIYANALTNNQPISQYLQKTTPDIYGASMLKAYSEIGQLTNEFRVSEYITKGIVTSDNHPGFIVFGTMYGDQEDAAAFNQLLADTPQDRLSSFIQNTFRYAHLSGQQEIIPFHTRIYTYNGTDVVGELKLAFSDQIIRNQFSILDTNSLFVSIDGNTYQFADNIFSEIEADTIFSAERYGVLDNCYYTEPIASFGQSRFIVADLNTEGWSIIQQMPPVKMSLSFPELNLYAILILIVSAVIACLIYLLLNHMINRPVNKICHQIACISDGNLDTRHESHASDEFSLISSAINDMARSLNNLMMSSLRQEKEKSNYKFQMLQSQINPHFMYNTLNSIRWMAEINNVPGIADMTSALAGMLKKLASFDQDQIDLAYELDFINQYSIIQSYRYGNIFSIKTHVENDCLLKAQILKFTLQPIVENAIFHGIMPKGKPGIISIGVYSRQADLVIEIEDDGVGFSELSDSDINTYTTNRKMNNHIGLANIKQRLALEYGEKYGLFIDSEKNKFTKVTIRIPMIFKETGGEDHVPTINCR